MKRSGRGGPQAKPQKRQSVYPVSRPRLGHGTYRL
jgi:hypothetical protein